MKLENIQLKYPSWRIAKDDLSSLVSLISIDDTMLTEDLLQMNLDPYTVDAGWYEGPRAFIVYLIKDYDWEAPIARIVASQLKSCYSAIDFCLSYGEALKNEIE